MTKPVTTNKNIKPVNGNKAVFQKEQGSIIRDLKISCFNEVKYKNVG